MNIFLLFWGCLLTLCCGWLIWRLVQLNKSLYQQSVENARLQKDMHGLLLCMRGVSDRFDQHQKQLRSVTVRQNDIATKNVADSHYEQAAFMMDKGASIDDLMKNCGLSRGEAEMMVRIHDLNAPQDNIPILNQAGLR